MGNLNKEIAYKINVKKDIDYYYEELEWDENGERDERFKYTVQGIQERSDSDI